MLFHCLFRWHWMTVFKQSFELCERGISGSGPASKKKLPAIGTAKRTPRLLYSHKANIFSKNPPATSCKFSIFDIKWSHSKARRGKARENIQVQVLEVLLWQR